MDAIRKMHSLKSETDGLYKTIAGFEEATREAVGRADQVKNKKVFFLHIFKKELELRNFFST